MWGNRQGWIISAVLTVLIAWGVFELGRVEAVGQPTSNFAALTQPIALPVAPSTIFAPTADGDAGDIYWKAIDAYQADHWSYDNFLMGRRGEPLGDEALQKQQSQDGARRLIEQGEKLPAIAFMLQAAPLKRATIFARRPAQIISYTPTPELDAIGKLGDILGQIGMANVLLDERAKAKEYLEAQFSLGEKLFGERLTHRELILGIGHLRSAAAGLASMARREGDSARVDAVQDFSRQAGKYYQDEILPLWKVVSAVDQNLISMHGGDVFALARSPKADVMWRVEAILKVGRYKYNAGNKGEQIAAGREPQQWANDMNPAIAAAAKAAQGLTLEGYRTINVLD